MKEVSVKDILEINDNVYCNICQDEGGDPVEDSPLGK